MYQVNLRDKLREQLQYLENSCNEYDAGHKSEAIRIATVIRVLIHDTKSSTSLLTHLKAKHISLQSTVSGRSDPSMSFFHGIGMARQKPDGSRELVPHFNAFGHASLLPVEDWWNEIVFVLSAGEVLSRKFISLAAANQDGGAHVDLNIKGDYAALATDGAAGTYLRNTDSGVVSATASDMHLVALRQMGFELLNSQELRNLVP